MRAALQRVELAVRDPRRGPVPGGRQAPDDGVVRPDHSRVLRRAQRDSPAPRSGRRSGWRIPVRWAADVAPCTSSARTAPSCPPVSPANCSSRAARSSSTSRTRQDRVGVQRPWLAVAGRHGLRRRGRLPVPHRPVDVHDRLRRGEHLPAGGGEPAGDAPQARRRGGVRRAQRRVRRRGQGRGAAGRGRRRGARRWRPSSSSTAERTWRATSARAQSNSTPSCPATRTASSTSGVSGSGTGRGGRPGSYEPDEDNMNARTDVNWTPLPVPWAVETAIGFPSSATTIPSSTRWRPNCSGRGSGRWRAGWRRSPSPATSSNTRSSTSRSSSCGSTPTPSGPTTTPVATAG